MPWLLITAPRPRDQAALTKAVVTAPQSNAVLDGEHGMHVTMGRVEACPVLGLKFYALGHNVIRGAAGAAILNAELLASRRLG